MSDVKNRRFIAALLWRPLLFGWGKWTSGNQFKCEDYFDMVWGLKKRVFDDYRIRGGWGLWSGSVLGCMLGFTLVLSPHGTDEHVFRSKIHTSTSPRPKHKESIKSQYDLCGIKNERVSCSRCIWLTPCRQYELLRNSLMSCSSVRREMWVVPRVTWAWPPTAIGLWVELKASSRIVELSSWSKRP